MIYLIIDRATHTTGKHLANAWAKIAEVKVCYNASELPEAATGSDFLLVVDPRLQWSSRILNFAGITGVYFIDTHVDLNTRLAHRNCYDYCFVAQHGALAEFNRRFTNNYYIPLATFMPPIKNYSKLSPKYDISFVGRMQGADMSLRRTIERSVVRMNGLRSLFASNLAPEEMLEIYSNSKVVLNPTVGREVNMRIFEALGQGAFVISDAAIPTELGLQSNRHYPVKQFVDAEGEISSDLSTLIYDLILKHDDERMRQASAAEVWAAHSYDNRVKRINNILMNAKRTTRGYPRFGYLFFKALWRSELASPRQMGISPLSLTGVAILFISALVKIRAKYRHWAY